MDNLLNLQKGELLNLTKEYSELKNITVSLGWDITNGISWDLDAFAFLMDKNNKIIDTVYFGKKNNKGIRLDKDNRTGAGEGPDENIFVTLDELDTSVVKIAFSVNIFHAGSCDDFSKIKNAFIQLSNSNTNEIKVKYKLNEKGRGFNAFHFADLILENNEWKFKAVGAGLNGEIKQIEYDVMNRKDNAISYYDPNFIFETNEINNKNEDKKSSKLFGLFKKLKNNY